MQTSVNSLLEYIHPIIEKCRKLWNSSMYFRVISIVSGSFAASLIARNIYIRGERKYLGLPPGVIGNLPFIGSALAMLDPVWLTNICKQYGGITTICVGSLNCILINNPYLAKQYYLNPRSNDQVSWFVNDIGFAFSNGKSWSDRRRIIYSNLMSTMKASYVEDVTKEFIKTKLFPIFDLDILRNKTTNIKPLFRPIGFNIILQSCFGSELSTLNDPFWIEYDKQQTEINSKYEIIELLATLFGNNKFGKMIQRMITGSDYYNQFEELLNIIDNYTQKMKNISTNNKYNDDVKLFNDYIVDYMSNNSNKLIFTRKHLLGDMMIMFFAATDTTYSTLAFALLLAAKYPNIQQEIYAEIKTAFGDNVDNIELRNDGIFKISKLRAFIHETLRIFPPVPVAGFRQLLSDPAIKLDTMKYGMDRDYYVHKNICTAINVCGINQTKEFWISDYNENKNKYKDINMMEPNLNFWLDENGKFTKKKNGSSLFTFHTGKRDCVGQSLAMKELIIVLAMIFIKYKIQSISGNTDFKIRIRFSGVVNEPKQTQIRVIQR